jgi:hypothetical protein
MQVGEVAIALASLVVLALVVAILSGWLTDGRLLIR